MTFIFYIPKDFTISVFLTSDDSIISLHSAGIFSYPSLFPKLLKLTNTVNGVAKNLECMQRKENETKLKELKDSLIRYYNKYKNVGEWSKLEKDAFWDLFEDYEKRGGDGYIHSIVEPVMRELREID